MFSCYKEKKEINWKSRPQDNIDLTIITGHPPKKRDNEKDLLMWENYQSIRGYTI
jgi:hypothetical protein